VLVSDLTRQTSALVLRSCWQERRRGEPSLGLRSRRNFCRKNPNAAVRRRMNDRDESMLRARGSGGAASHARLALHPMCKNAGRDCTAPRARPQGGRVGEAASATPILRLRVTGPGSILLCHMIILPHEIQGHDQELACYQKRGKALPLQPLAACAPATWSILFAGGRGAPAASTVARNRQPRAVMRRERIRVRLAARTRPRARRDTSVCFRCPT